MSDLGLTLVRAIDERDAALKRLAVAERERDTIKRAAHSVIRAWDRPIGEGDPRRQFDVATVGYMMGELRKAAGLEPKP